MNNMDPLRLYRQASPPYQVKRCLIRSKPKYLTDKNLKPKGLKETKYDIFLQVIVISQNILSMSILMLLITKRILGPLQQLFQVSTHFYTILDL